MKRRKVVLGLVVALAMAVPLVVAAPAMGAPSDFSGDVESDFAGPDVVIFTDPGAQPDVGMPPTPPGVSGWDMKDLRLAYDRVNDTMYVGINTFTILGDADGEGDPSVTSTYLTGLGGTDVPNLGGTESAAVYFDLDQDGTWDVIAGISGATDYSGASVSVFEYLATPPYFSPERNFGTPLPSNGGNVSANPDATHPDLEGAITKWSTLPGHDTSLGFDVGARLGSGADAGIGEDFLQASFSPSIHITKQVSKNNVNFFDADNATSALNVNAGDNVYFRYIVTNTGDVTLTNITLSDDTHHDVSTITVTDPLAPQASFQGVIGPITPLSGLRTDVATATGDWGGFTVEGTDPANYSMSPAVGGTAFPVGKLGLLAPWAILLGCAGIVTLLMLRKRHQA